MQYIKPDVSTICIGVAASVAAAFDYSTKGALRTAIFPDHDSSAGGTRGQATDIEIEARKFCTKPW